MSEPSRNFARDEHIVVDHLSKSFGAKDVLRDISLVVPRGKTTVILGGSGAGKTTLLRILIALERPTSGHIFVDGEDLVGKNDLELNQIRQKFGMVFQYAALLDSLSVMENVAFPLREHTKMSDKDVRAAVTEKLEILGLRGTEKLFPSELSGGMRKRVGLARALMLKPAILIYDEPTSGLDPTTSRMVDDLIEQMREMFQVTNVVISHDMTSAFRIAHRAYLLVDGRIAAAGTPDEILQSSADTRKFIDASGVDVGRISRPPG
ncbi:MAG TPA: ATP-binding cassette domain-containing protein [Polyangiaceae bacterium]|nr:ATP-binding cassette domain-containing protein [Polyangiaceae bacterium]